MKSIKYFIIKNDFKLNCLTAQKPIGRSVFDNQTILVITITKNQ